MNRHSIQVNILVFKRHQIAFCHQNKTLLTKKPRRKAGPERLHNETRETSNVKKGRNVHVRANACFVYRLPFHV